MLGASTLSFLVSINHKPFQSTAADGWHEEGALLVISI
jgi:hypothetical protein